MLRCRPSTEIVIEGFPRSANTFFYFLLRRYLPNDFSIAHHVHHPSQLILGLQYKIPTILLIRKPKDAVLSYAIRTEVSFNHALRHYIHYYSALKPYLNNLVILDFDDVAFRHDSVLKELFQRFPNLFVNKNELFSSTAIFTEIDEHSLLLPHESAEMRIARPSKQRALIKKAMESDFDGKPNYTRKLKVAENLYQGFLALKLDPLP